MMMEDRAQGIGRVGCAEALPGNAPGSSDLFLNNL